MQNLSSKNISLPPIFLVVTIGIPDSKYSMDA